MDPRPPRPFLQSPLLINRPGQPTFRSPVSIMSRLLRTVCWWCAGRVSISSSLRSTFRLGFRAVCIAAPAGCSRWDIDGERGTLAVRQGKGKKDRHIPVSGRALGWVGRWRRGGAAFERWRLTGLVRKHLGKAGIGKTGGCHLFRHTVATMMLENGADIRVIQEMLGHAKIATTELYTRVSINLLRTVYLATHPGAGGVDPGVDAGVDPEVAREMLDELMDLDEGDEGESSE